MSGCSLNPAEHPLQKLHKESKILIKEPSPIGVDRAWRWCIKRQLLCTKKHVRHPEALGKMADRRISGSRVSCPSQELLDLRDCGQRLRTEAADRGCGQRLRTEAADRGCGQRLRTEAADRGCEAGFI
uniref:Uncharacterized protein n=1 Tax=Knipowitschia caucasica TaxID=637954 RepID=A0AAV2J581_KNICA